MAVTYFESIPILKGEKARSFIEKVQNASKNKLSLSEQDKKLVQEIKKFSNWE